ncbi:hypothetical protein BDZ89DRAFT_1120789, partial [Hymenopellis radicata]
MGIHSASWAGHPSPVNVTGVQSARNKRGNFVIEWRHTGKRLLLALRKADSDGRGGGDRALRTSYRVRGSGRRLGPCTSMTRGFLDPMTSPGPLQSYLVRAGCGEMTPEVVLLLRPSDTFESPSASEPIEFNVNALRTEMQKRAVQLATRSVALVKLRVKKH